MTVVYLHDWLLLFGFLFGLRACVEEDNLSNVWCEGKRYTNPKAKGGVYIVSCYATFGYVSNDICFHVFFTVKFFPHRVVLTGRVKTFVLRIQPLLISPMYEFSEMCMVPSTPRPVLLFIQKNDGWLLYTLYRVYCTGTTFMTFAQNPREYDPQWRHIGGGSRALGVTTQFL